MLLAWGCFLSPRQSQTAAIVRCFRLISAWRGWAWVLRGERRNEPRGHGWRARVRGARQASAACRRWASRPVRGGWRVCFQESFAGQSSWRVREKLSFKFLPGVNEVVAGDDGLEARGIQRAGLDELQQAGFVLGASSLERDGRKMFGR